MEEKILEVKSIGIKKSKVADKKGWLTRIIGVDQLNFGEILQNSAAEKQEQFCADLILEIDAQALLLKKAVTPERLKHYRELVKTFMKEALPNTYLLHEEQRWDRSGHQRNLIIVKKVNEQLESLMHDVTSKEMPLKLIARLDQIRGLLLDLLG